MDRRKFLIGAGSLAAGGAAATGSGAFTAMSADRDANISVVADDSGLLALDDATKGKVVQQREDGELAIDFGAPEGASGINTNSAYQIGTMSGSFPGSLDPLEKSPNGAYNNPAFRIQNNTSKPKDITIEFDADLPSGAVGMNIDAKTSGDAFGGGATAGSLIMKPSGGGGSQGKTAEVYDVPAGEYAGVAILVHADVDREEGTTAYTEADVGEDLSGELLVESSNPA